MVGIVQGWSNGGTGRRVVSCAVGQISAKLKWTIWANGCAVGYIRGVQPSLPLLGLSAESSHPSFRLSHPHCSEWRLVYRFYRMKETGGDEAAGAVGYASSAGASLGPPAEASGTTPGLASGTLPVEVVSSPRVLSSGNAARVGDNPRQCRDSGKGSATAAEATSVVSGVVAMEDIERDTSSSPTFLDVGQLHGGQAEAEVQPPTPSLRLPFNSTPGDAAELRTHEGESSDDDTGLKAVLAYQIEPQPQSGGGLESSVVSPPAAAAIASSTRPDLLTLSPDNPFC
jgi:hypothetical protein